MSTRGRNVLYFQAVMPARPKRRKAWRDAGRSAKGLEKANAGRCGRGVADPSAGPWPTAGAERPRDDPRACMMPNCTPAGRERQGEKLCGLGPVAGRNGWRRTAERPMDAAQQRGGASVPTGREGMAVRPDGTAESSRGSSAARPPVAAAVATRPEGSAEKPRARPGPARILRRPVGALRLKRRFPGVERSKAPGRRRRCHPPRRVGGGAPLDRSRSACRPSAARGPCQPSPKPGRIGLRIVSFGAVSVFARGTACQLADGRTPPSVSQASATSLPP